jgi:hypothetical protein
MKLLILLIVSKWISFTIALQPPSQQSSTNRRVFLQNIPLIAAGTTAALIGTTTLSINPSVVNAADGTTTPSVSTAIAGEKAPSFTLPNSRGDGTTSLEQLVQSKKWTVLYFYPGAFSKGMTIFFL